jgi:AcrR family transcriptional regulator
MNTTALARVQKGKTRSRPPAAKSVQATPEKASMSETSKLGRPRAFSEETALEAAMRVFWVKGYEGTSLTDLTEAMGINRPSLYGTFGDKEALFRKVMQRYAEGPASYIQNALNQPTARGVVEALVLGAVQMLCDPQNPRGCLSIQGALASSDEAIPIRNALITWRKQGEAEIRKRFNRALAEGDLPQGVDPGDLTRYLSIVITGMGVQAANRATKSEMIRAAEFTLRTLPFNPRLTCRISSRC